MSEVVDRLMRAGSLAWADLVPAIDHAITLAQEAEYKAFLAEQEALCQVDPVYPPLVLKLAASVREDEDDE